MRAVLIILSLAGERISITSINDAIVSLPIYPGQIETPEWQNTYVGRLVDQNIRARKDTLTKAQVLDLNNAVRFALELWPAEDPRTRSNILSTWTGMASKFVYSPLRELFSSGTFSFTPSETTHQHKIVIVDMPVLEYGRDVSRLCQILLKIAFQKAWLRHQYKPGCCNGAFLFQDEFSMLMHKHEGHFHSVCRGSAIAPICITPNISAIAAEEFGENDIGSRTSDFLGNLPVKIFHRQTDIRTCEFAANTIGKHWMPISSYGASTGQSHAHVGGQMQLVHIVDPLAFTELLKPSGQNVFADAIVYKGGSAFEATKTETNPQGLNYLRVRFSRDI